MAHSTTRGLLYTTPPADEAEQETDGKPTSERSPAATATSNEAQHSQATADD